MGTGWVSPKAPTQTDFFFFYARIRVENGGSFSCSEAQNGNLKRNLISLQFLMANKLSLDLNISN